MVPLLDPAQIRSVCFALFFLPLSENLMKTIVFHRIPDLESRLKEDLDTLNSFLKSKIAKSVKEISNKKRQA